MSVRLQLWTLYKALQVVHRPLGSFYLILKRSLSRQDHYYPHVLGEKIKDLRVQGHISTHSQTLIELSCSVVQVHNPRARMNVLTSSLSSWTAGTVSDAFLCSQGPTQGLACGQHQRLYAKFNSKCRSMALGIPIFGVSALSWSLEIPWLKGCHNSCCVY